MARHNVATDPLPPDFDREADEPALVADLDLSSCLSRAVRAGAITELESRLIEATRLGDSSLEEAAKETGCRYGTLRMRRARAESRLRSYYGVDGASE